jgi:pyridoxamine 5'-phosphate oxidase
MLFSNNNSLSEIFRIVKNELENGVTDPNHPFKFVSLATHREREIELRYVVFRKIDQDLNMFFFTDSRSEKISHLKSNPELALLFYHDSKRVQVRVKGFANIHHLDEVAARFWSEIPVNSQKGYNSERSPGSKIASPELAYQWNEEMDNAFFTVIRVEPRSVDVLQLNDMEHIRVSFLKKERDWQMDWLVP